MTERRWLWKFWQAQLHPFRLVFFDEIGVNTKMACHHGQAFRGERMVSKVSAGHWKTTTFVGALRATGITVPLMVDGPMNVDMFLAYVQQHLAPRSVRRRGDHGQSLQPQEGRRSRSD
ncbi:MAG: transposase [Pirellulales bacterium]|nr:transposase [Pirellulales bacterium]